jgi:hypothetical protein
VERVLRAVFPNSEAYQYNPASIRVRVIDDRFDGLSYEDRDGLVEPLLARLPEDTQAKILNLLTVSPSELLGLNRRSLVNLEFEDPSPSNL